MLLHEAVALEGAEQARGRALRQAGVLGQLGEAPGGVGLEHERQQLRAAVDHQRSCRRPLELLFHERYITIAARFVKPKEPACT